MAESRHDQVKECLAELPECNPGALDSSRCDTMEQGCRSMLDGELGVHGNCGLQLEDGGQAEQECAIYGPIGEAPPGAFVKSIGWRLFRSGLRGCDVIQKIEYKEGGTMPLPQSWQKYLGVEEKNKTLNIQEVSTLRTFLDKEKRYQSVMATGSEHQNYMNDVGYLVAISGMTLDLDAFPEIKWIPFGPIWGFRIDDVACTPQLEAESEEERELRQVEQETDVLEDATEDDYETEDGDAAEADDLGKNSFQ